MNLYEIKEMAIKSKKAVYTIQQLANLISKPKSIAKVYASRLVKKGLAIRLVRGRISFSKDDYVIASQFVEPSYISTVSALSFHQLITQVPTHVECVNTKNSRKYEKLGIIYRKIPGSMFFGYKKYQKDNSYILVAEPEKAVIDAIYLNIITKDLVREIMPNLNVEKLIEYTKKIKCHGKKKLEGWIL